MVGLLPAASAGWDWQPGLYRALGGASEICPCCRGLPRVLRVAVGFGGHHWSHAAEIASFSWVGCLGFSDGGAEPKLCCLWLEKDGLWRCWTWECSELKPRHHRFSWWIWLLLASKKDPWLCILSLLCFP